MYVRVRNAFDVKKFLSVSAERVSAALENPALLSVIQLGASLPSLVLTYFQFHSVFIVGKAFSERFRRLFLLLCRNFRN